jgi:hypothetical protein
MDGTHAALERVDERRACACELLPTFSYVRMSLLLMFPGEYIRSRSRDPAVLLALSIVVDVIGVLIVVGMS